MHTELAVASDMLFFLPFMRVLMFLNHALRCMAVPTSQIRRMESGAAPRPRSKALEQFYPPQGGRTRMAPTLASTTPDSSYRSCLSRHQPAAADAVQLLISVLQSLAAHSDILKKSKTVLYRNARLEDFILNDATVQSIFLSSKRAIKRRPRVPGTGFFVIVTAK